MTFETFANQRQHPVRITIPMHLTPPQHHHHLHAIARIHKPPDLTQLGLHVPQRGLRPQLHLVGPLPPMPTRPARSLRRLIGQTARIRDPKHRRIRIRNPHQLQPDLVGPRLGLTPRHHTHMCAVVIQDPNLTTRRTVPHRQTVTTADNPITQVSAQPTPLTPARDPSRSTGVTDTRVPHSPWVTTTTAAAICRRLGEDGHQFLDRLDTTVRYLLHRWNLTPTTPLGGGTYSAVIAATTNDGTEVILKVSPDPDAVTAEARVYKAWAEVDRTLCPNVVAFDPVCGALCITRLRPGTPIGDQLRTPGSDIPLLRRHLSGITQADLQAARGTLGDHLIRRTSLIEERLDALYLPDTPHLLETIHLAAEQASAVESTPALCHGDLHPDNVLTSGSTFALIDPIGLAGAPEFDAAYLAVTSSGGVGIVERLRSYHTHLGLDPHALAAHSLFITVDRLVIEHWYQHHPEQIGDLRGAIDRLTTLIDP